MYKNIFVTQKFGKPAQKAMCSPSASLCFSWAVKDLIWCFYFRYNSKDNIKRLQEYVNSKSTNIISCFKRFQLCSLESSNHHRWSTYVPGKIPKMSGFSKICLRGHLFVSNSFIICQVVSQIRFMWTSVMYNPQYWSPTGGSRCCRTLTGMSQRSGGRGVVGEVLTTSAALV